MSVEVTKTEDGIKIEIHIKGFGYSIDAVKQFFKLLPFEPDEESTEPS